MSKQLLRCSVVVETEAGRLSLIPFKIAVDVTSEADLVAEAAKLAALRAVENLVNGKDGIMGMKTQ